MVVFQISAGAYPCLQHGPAHIPNEYRPPFSVDHLPREVEQVVKQRGSTVSPEIRPVLFVELVRVFYRVTSDSHGTAITKYSAVLPQGRLELFTCDTAQLGDLLAIYFD